MSQAMTPQLTDPGPVANLSRYSPCASLRGFPTLSRSRRSLGLLPARMAKHMLVDMSQLPVEDAPGINDAAHEAASGRVVYITEEGRRLAAIVPAEYAAALEAMNPEQAAELLEDLADSADAREALAELAAGAEPVPAEQLWAELGIDQ